MDRRTNSPDGSGRASGTVVTSRVSDEELAGQEPLAPANGGTTADTAADVTAVDAVPPLPADNLASSRATQPKGKDAAGAPAVGADREASKADGTAPAAPVTSPAGFRDSSADGTPPTAPPGSRSSAAYPSGAGRVDTEPAPATVPPAAVPSTAVPPTTVPPASFAWDMPEPPADSPSSPARTFLRSGATTKAATTKAKRDSGPAAAAPGPQPALSQSPLADEPVNPARSAASQTPPKRSVRQAHLTVARVEPWSVMKFSFVVSLVAFVILFVAVSVLYGVLSGVGVFDSLQRVVSSLTSSQGSNGVNAKAWFSASRVLGYTALLGSLNIVLITAMSTIGSVIYNLASRLVGGVEVTLRETE